MHVRLATPQDRATLVDFNARLALESEGKQLDRARLDEGVAALLADEGRGRYFMALEGGRCVGALAITREWSDWRCGWFWWIQSVYVVPEARGRKVYRALHDEVQRRALAEGDVCGLRLYVERGNQRARTVYEAVGMHSSHYELYEVEFGAGAGQAGQAGHG